MPKTEQVGLQSLPIDVILHISRYLSLYDILSCSLTCRYLRDSLNENFVWRRYLLDKDITMLTLLLQLAQPIYQLPHMITTLCKNKELVMRKTGFLNNWRKGNFIEHSTTRSLNSPTYSFILSGRNLHYKSRYIFVPRFKTGHNSDAIEVWDLANVPVLYTSVQIEDFRFTEFFIMDTNLVVIECCRVTVYFIAIPEKSFPVLFSFLITNKKSVTFGQPAYHTREHNLGHDQSCQTWRHYNKGNFLISHNTSQCIIYIWNASKPAKVSANSFSSSISIAAIYPNLKNNMCLVHTQNNDSSSFIAHFDFEKNSPGIIATVNKPFLHIIYFNQYIIICFWKHNVNNSEDNDLIQFLLYEYEIDKKLKKTHNRKVRHCLKHDIRLTTVINDMLVIPCQKHLKIFNALTLEIVKCVNLDCNVQNITHYFDVFGLVFVVTSNSNDMLELWDLLNDRKIPLELNRMEVHQVQLDELCSKLVYYDSRKITVKHFW